MSKILVVVAHPDDEVLGCGGYIAKKIREGHEVRVLCWAKISTRQEKKTPEQSKCLTEAAKVLGHQASFVRRYIGPYRLYETQDAYSSQELEELAISEVEAWVNFSCKNYPFSEILYHDPESPNLQHARLGKACEILSRKAKKAMTFIVPENRNRIGKIGNYYCELTDEDKNKKIEAFNKYKDVVEKPGTFRTEEGIIKDLEYMGFMCGAKYAENFEIRRIIE